MPLHTLACPNCGAPLPKHARWTAVKCAHCGAVAAPGMSVVSRKTFRDALARVEREIAPAPEDVEVDAARYRLLTRIAEGDRADVLLATRARALTERTVLKVLRHDRDASLDREWDALAALHASDAQGSAHFTLRLPPLVARGEARFAGGRRGTAIVFRALPGFEGTVADLAQAAPAGLEPRHAVWIWRRLLEILGWVHRSGWAHGAVVPSHVLLSAREHGPTLVSWSRAVPVGSGGSIASDLAMSAQAVLTLLGEGEQAPPFEQLLRACASGDLPSTDGWAMKETVAETARRAFRPPAFVPLTFSPPRRQPSTKIGGFTRTRPIAAARSRTSIPSSPRPAPESLCSASGSPASTPIVTDLGRSPPSPRELGDALVEPHNVDGSWQGPFRVGWPDCVLARYARAVAGRIDGLALTHVDALDRVPAWNIAESYAGGAVTDWELSAPTNLAERARSAEALRNIEPDLIGVPPTEIEAALQRAYAAPAVLRSIGPRWIDVRTSAPWRP